MRSAAGGHHEPVRQHLPDPAEHLLPLRGRQDETVDGRPT
jgi:hypothetical protein